MGVSHFQITRNISLQKEFAETIVLLAMSVLVLLINLSSVCYHYANISFFGNWCFVITTLIPRSRHTSIYNFQHTSRQQRKTLDRLCFTRIDFSCL